MFWKKKTPRQTKKLTRKEILSHIERLSAGESVSYRLPEVYGGQLAVVEFSTEFPWRGSKYRLSIQTLIDGKPVGEKERVLETDEAKDLAAWLSERRGKLDQRMMAYS